MDSQNQKKTKPIFAAPRMHWVITIIGFYTGWRKKRPEHCITNGMYTLWRKISFYTFVNQYVLVLTYKFQ